MGWRGHGTQCTRLLLGAGCTPQGEVSHCEAAAHGPAGVGSPAENEGHGGVGRAGREVPM